jgi:hypothetical protein
MKHCNYSQMPTVDAVVRIRPYFCCWNIGQTALAPLYVPLQAKDEHAALMVCKDKPEMNCKNIIPLLFGHGQEGFVTQNTRIRNKNVDASKFAHGNLDESLAILSRADCGSCLATA